MIINGIGIICSRGEGIALFEDALREGWRPPDLVPAQEGSSEKRNAYLVNFDTVRNKSLLKKIRRADRLSKMAVVAAASALTDSGREAPGNRSTGIILATALGAHGTTFSFLDNMLDYGDTAVSPTLFSNSVHNAAASYIAESLGIKGPTLTITQFRSSFQASLQLARIWLEQGRCNDVLVGAVDQYGEVLGYVAALKMGSTADGRIKPFLWNEPSPVPGEGAVFFVMSRGSSEGAYCSVDSIRSGRALPDCKRDLDILDADGMIPTASCYARSLSIAVPAAAYAPLYGSLMTGNAFSVAAGALMLKNQVLYGTPVPENTGGVRVLTDTGPSRVDTIRCIGCDCSGEQSEIFLSSYGG